MRAGWARTNELETLLLLLTLAEAAGRFHGGETGSKLRLPRPLDSSRQPRREREARGPKDCGKGIQVGDRCRYLVDGHEERLKPQGIGPELSRSIPGPLLASRWRGKEGLGYRRGMTGERLSWHVSIQAIPGVYRPSKLVARSGSANLIPTASPPGPAIQETS